MTALPETRWLELELANEWLTIRLNDVETRNALTDALTSELTDVLIAVRDHDAVRGITLRGNGGVFCAGGDLKAFDSIRRREGEDAENAAVATSLEGAGLFWLVRHAPQVVVVLIEGAAVAGGLGLACAADFVFAMDNAVLSFSETRLGLVPAQIAPYVIGRTGVRRARRMLLTGVRMRGAEALEHNLIDGVATSSAELEQLEAELIDDVLRCAPGAIQSTKHIIDRIEGFDFESFQRYAAAAFTVSLTGDEGREGVDAFFDKRAPSWSPDADN